LQPSTSIWVSSIVHFLRAFFSGGAGLPRRRSLPRRSSDGEGRGRPVSSRNLKAGTSRSEAGVASETRRCFGPEGEGKGAVKENVDVCVLMVVAIVGRDEGADGEERKDFKDMTEGLSIKSDACWPRRRSDVFERSPSIPSSPRPLFRTITSLQPTPHPLLTRSVLRSPTRAGQCGAADSDTSCFYYARYDDTSNSGAIRSATPSIFFFQASSLSASFPICPPDSTRGCTHVITALWSTWSIEPRINFRLCPFGQHHNVKDDKCEGKKAPQRFHDKVLDLIQWQSGLFGDGLERHRPVIGTPREDRLDQCHEADLLPQERIVSQEYRLK
jgi:hypothetical protein